MEKNREEIMKLKTSFPISSYAQLYINGDLQVLARYPNIDATASHYQGYAADAMDPDRAAKWEHPEGVKVHAVHSGEWSGFQNEIESANKNRKVKLKGGHQKPGRKNY